jgi:hypothetical protein
MDKKRIRFGITTSYKLFGFLPIPRNSLVSVIYLDSQQWANLQASMNGLKAILAMLPAMPFEIVCQESV